MLYSFVTTIVEVAEINFPILLNAFFVHGITMILRSQVSFVGSGFNNGLVVTAMTKFQFVRLCSRSQRNQLMPKANPKNGFVL